MTTLNLNELMILSNVSGLWIFGSPSISKISNISEEFFITFRLIFYSAYFFFDNCIYRQKFGMPMESPVIADIVSLLYSNML